MYSYFIFYAQNPSKKVPPTLQMKFGLPEKSQSALESSSGAPTNSFSPLKRISLGGNKPQEERILAHLLISPPKMLLNLVKTTATQN